MTRAKQTKLNILAALLYQTVTAICGLILPRFILLHFGSEVNGLMQSVSQMLGYTVLLEGGIGGVVLAALYGPLARGDQKTVSGIFYGTKRFFGRISAVFAVFALVLSMLAGKILPTELGAGYVALLVLLLAANSYFNYYFGLPHQLLMKADQRLYVVQITQMVTTVLNLLACILAMELGAGIHLVKLITVAVFAANPLVYRWYVKKHYALVKPADKEKQMLPQKRDAVVHHLSFFIHRNTDVVILSLFSGLGSASVYSVYNAVILTMEHLLASVSSGVAGALGNIIAKDEKKTLTSSFDLYEAVNTALAAAFTVVAAAHLLPFVSIYTRGVEDVRYVQPLFAGLMLAAGFAYCLRMPYGTVVSTAGHYRQTRFGAVGEVVLNLAVSLTLVKPMGLAGVAAGTLVGMIFRTVYLAWYLSKKLLQRPLWKFFVSLAGNFLLGAGLFLLFPERSAGSLLQLIWDAAKMSAVVFPVMLAANLLPVQLKRKA